MLSCSNELDSLCHLFERAMLEPLLALSLAGNVIQIVQFSAQLASKAREVRKSGVFAANVELRHVTIDLLAQTVAVTASLRQTVLRSTCTKTLPGKNF